jgi:hypothetical protein
MPVLSAKLCAATPARDQDRQVFMKMLAAAKVATLTYGSFPTAWEGAAPEPPKTGAGAGAFEA